jgi:putative ABC transport system permease protein
MRFHTFVLKNVLRRRMRSSLTIVGIAVAVGGVVALIGISSSTESSFKKIYERQNVAVIVQQRGAKQRLTSVLDDTLGKEIEKIPGVKAANPGLVDFTSIEELGADAVVVQGWDADSPLMKKLEIAAGRTMTKDDAKCVLLGEDLAVALEKKVGDKMQIFDKANYTVIGTFQSPIAYENRSMVMLLGDLQRIMGRKGQVTGFAVIVDHPDNEAEVDGIIKAIAALGTRIDAKRAAESVTGTTEIRFIRATSWITSAVAIIIGAVGMLNTMIMSVSERTKEIGILRAIGWRRWRIVRMVMVESMLLSVSGGVVGTLAAVALTGVLAKHPAVAGLITAEISPVVVCFGIVSALLVGILGAAYPAYRGAQLLPTEALRHE